MTNYLEMRPAFLSDLKQVRQFTDYWLAGRGMKDKAPGAVNDYFISPKQHTKYIQKYTTHLGFTDGLLVAWAVVQNNGSLIHLLIAGNHRGKGFGTAMLLKLSPGTIHSKSNQSTGNPARFYEKQGYRKIRTVKSNSRFDINEIRPDRKPIIDIYEKT